MANAHEEAITKAITVIHTLVDEVTWQHVFREYFETPELFHSVEVNIEPGCVTLTLNFYNPENLTKLIQEVVEIKDSGCVPTLAGAKEILNDALERVKK
jgi:hypothetical protein